MKSKAKKVLIIEDDQSIIYPLTVMLGALTDVNVLIAKDGERGLLLAQEEKPDLILLDIVMPKMDGIEMLRELRKSAWGKSAKVIVMSNLSNPEKETQVTRLGVKDYMIKADCRIGDIADLIKKKLKSC